MIWERNRESSRQSSACTAKSEVQLREEAGAFPHQKLPCTSLGGQSCMLHFVSSVFIKFTNAEMPSTEQKRIASFPTLDVVL